MHSRIDHADVCHLARRGGYLAPNGHDDQGAAKLIIVLFPVGGRVLPAGK